MKDDRPCSFLLQFCVDVPDHRLALLLIHLARLLVKKLLQLAVAVSVVRVFEATGQLN